MRKILKAALFVVVLAAGCAGCSNPMQQIEHPIPSDAPITLSPFPTTTPTTP